MNPVEPGRGGVGFYFDTWGSEPQHGGQRHQVRALVWAGGTSHLLNKVVGLTWGEFHEWTIEWSETEVIFYIDAAEVARASYSFATPLPVGVWNDRPPEMLTDWVEVLETSRIVGIDIKPGSDPNCFNINGQGVVPVSILGSSDFDVSEIDALSLTFDGLAVRVRGKRGPLCSQEDSNGDGYPDLVCHFEDDAEYWAGGGDTGTVTGVLYDGTEFEGSDSICIVP